MRVSGLLFCKHVFLRQQEWSLLRMHIFSVKAVSGWMKMKKTLVGILVCLLAYRRWGRFIRGTETGKQ